MASSRKGFPRQRISLRFIPQRVPASSSCANDEFGQSSLATRFQTRTPCLSETEAAHKGGSRTCPIGGAKQRDSSYRHRDFRSAKLQRPSSESLIRGSPGVPENALAWCKLTLLSLESKLYQDVRWSERRDSNPRPLVPQTSALTGLRYTPTPQRACVVLRFRLRSRKPSQCEIGTKRSLWECRGT